MAVVGLVIGRWCGFGGGEAHNRSFVFVFAGGAGFYREGDAVLFILPFKPTQK